MRHKIQTFWFLARFTALDLLRQPAFLLSVTSCGVFITLLPVLITHQLGEPGRLVRDSALAIIFFGGLWISCFASCSALQGERDQGTAQLLLTKPVNRDLFFLAKLAGVCGAVSCFFIYTSIATILCTDAAADLFEVHWRTLYFLLAAPVLGYLIGGLAQFKTTSSFCAPAMCWTIIFVLMAFMVARLWPGEHAHLIPLRNIVPSLMLIAFATLLYIAIAAAFATRLSLWPTTAFCLGIFLLGLFSDYYFGQHAEQHLFARACYFLFPNWQHFWTADALNRISSIPATYILQCAAYTLTYLAGVLCIGTWLFKRAEIK